MQPKAKAPQAGKSATGVKDLTPEASFLLLEMAVPDEHGVDPTDLTFPMASFRDALTFKKSGSIPPGEYVRELQESGCIVQHDKGTKDKSEMPTDEYSVTDNGHIHARSKRFYEYITKAVPSKIKARQQPLKTNTTISDSPSPNGTADNPGLKSEYDTLEQLSQAIKAKASTLAVYHEAAKAG